MQSIYHSIYHCYVCVCVCVCVSIQACGPQYGYMCGQQQFISGVCANVSSSFEVLNSIAPAVQGTVYYSISLSLNTTRKYTSSLEVRQ